MLFGLAGIAVALVLMFLGLPVGYALALVGIGGFAAVVGVQPALSVFGQVTFDTVSNASLVVLPLFLLMGNLVGGRMAVEGRLARLVYASLYRMHLVAVHGWLKGLALILVGHVNRIVRPRLKLH